MYHEHTHCIYQTIWSPHAPDIFASAAGDHSLKIWDTKCPRSIQTIMAHHNEILALDWNKYREGVLVTGSVDKSIKVWDLRFPDRELLCLSGHEYAIRRLKCSPHTPSIIGSVSYDMTLRLWDIDHSTNHHLLKVYNQHTEFVLGLDFNLHIPGQIATCAWDEEIVILQPHL